MDKHNANAQRFKILLHFNIQFPNFTVNLPPQWLRKLPAYLSRVMGFENRWNQGVFKKQLNG